MFYSEVNGLAVMEALDNALYGSWRLLTTDILSVSFVHFNVAASFLGTIPTYGVLPYAMILIPSLSTVLALIYGMF